MAAVIGLGGLQVDVALGEQAKADEIATSQQPSGVVVSPSSPLKEQATFLAKPVDLNKRIEQLAKTKIAPNATSFTLSNGMQVVVIPDHRAPVVVHMVWYRVGGGDEKLGKSGLAHLFEHMMFRGTKKYPGQAIFTTIAKLGGYSNAFTSYDQTAYFEQVAKQHLGVAMELEADRMQNLLINDEVFQTERNVVHEERRLRVDTQPAELFEEALSAALFNNHHYGIPVIGWGGEIAALTREDALAFYQLHYRPENAVLVVAGDVTVDEVRKHGEETYGKIKGSGKSLPKRVRDAQEPPPIAERRLIYRSERLEQPGFRRSYLVPTRPSLSVRMAGALQVLDVVLGYGATSVFYRTLVDEEKLAASVWTSYYSMALDDFSFEIGVTPRPGVELGKIEQRVNEIIADVALNGISQQQLNLAKVKLMVGAIKSQDNPSAMARHFGFATSVSLPISAVQNSPAMVGAITIEDVQEAAKNYMTLNRAVTGFLIPQKN